MKRLAVFGVAVVAGTVLTVVTMPNTTTISNAAPTIEAVTTYEGMVSYYGNNLMPYGDSAEQWAAEVCMDTSDEPGRNPDNCFLDAMGEVGWTYIAEGEGGWAWGYSDPETNKMLAALEGVEQ